MIQIRAAAQADIAAISAIYDHAIATTAAVWRDAPTGPAERAEWLAGRQAGGFPVLAAERDGRLLGFASYGPMRAFEGYRFTVENSVFVADDARGQGVARALMEALIARAQAQGLHRMVAAIDGDNLASIRLHASLGFVETGRMAEVGFKFGRWLDLVWMQRALCAFRIQSQRGPFNCGADKVEEGA